MRTGTNGQIDAGQRGDAARPGAGGVDHRWGADPARRRTRGHDPAVGRSLNAGQRGGGMKRRSVPDRRAEQMGGGQHGLDLHLLGIEGPAGEAVGQVRLVGA
jgi:hypothetical protein